MTAKSMTLPRDYTAAGDPADNSLTAKKTTVATTKTKVVFPDEGTTFKIHHITAATYIWIGNQDDVAVNGDAIPLGPEMVFEITIAEGEEPNVYAVVASGTADIFVYGSITE